MDASHEYAEHHTDGSVSMSTPGSPSSAEGIEHRFPELEHVNQSSLSDQIQAFTTVLKRLQQELDEVSH
ncbi:MAG: hypothetical protein ABF780_05940 [Bifidobacterium aquikefiri]|uniref:Uncharacterized protein n=1 Tax=Bifidobacterium aquikefiri TaxID=1653207 RepID=A0A261G1X7_9BIFI|nr:hypothetical protein [Bifidobacterium aquikefiri]OZG65420.1 hypothetical protein BAQU_1603 [Bifidobacterium aquikefiri]